MALRRALSKRLCELNIHRRTSPPVSPDLSPAAPSLHRQYFTSPNSGGRGFIRGFLQRRALNQAAGRLPELFSLPVGDKLRERLWGAGSAAGSLHLEGLTRPIPAAGGPAIGMGLSVAEAKKILRLAKMEELKSKLQEMSEMSISYGEYSKICAQVCGNDDQGMEFAKMLDDCGSVIVLGNVVFLRPEQVAKSMETLIRQSAPAPNDPRRVELEKMEEQKLQIDKKAWAKVWAEVSGGLGFFMAQTLFFMRLTFWELSWDVMEPICFFTGSLYFGLAAGFFLRTSTEPTFEGYSNWRFKSKQKKLMKAHNFDVQRYTDLCRVFYPNGVGFSRGKQFFTALDGEKASFTS